MIPICGLNSDQWRTSPVMSHSASPPHFKSLLCTDRMYYVPILLLLAGVLSNFSLFFKIFIFRYFSIRYFSLFSLYIFRYSLYIFRYSLYISKFVIFQNFRNFPVKFKPKFQIFSHSWPNLGKISKNFILFITNKTIITARNMYVFN